MRSWSLVTAAHRARLVYVYVRQSSVNQVRQPQESTTRRIARSIAPNTERHGFQRLIAEIGLGNAGLVLSLGASRLARNNRDWHRLPERCLLFGAILANGARLCDREAYHDRLLLGLSGITSEAEPHPIRLACIRAGARRRRAANCGFLAG